LLDSKTKAAVITLILSGRTEEALELVSKKTNVACPKLAVGLPKGHSASLGCYVAKDKTIYVLDGEYLSDPRVILHEMYHHLRTHTGEHRGTERKAREFALDFVRAFETAVLNKTSEDK
jgi:hypothetical protein